MKQGYQIVAVNDKEVDVLVYGMIADWADVKAKDFAMTLQALKGKYSTINLRLNTNGGSVFEGNTIITLMQDSNATINTIVDGVAASMGSVILQYGAKRKAARNAMIMVHKPSGGSFGQASALRSTADLLDKLENNLAESYAKSTGKTVEEVKALWLQDNKDTWFTAQEALDAGLIDEIIEPRVKDVKLPKNLSSECVSQYITEFQNALIETIPTDTKTSDNNMKILASLIAAFGLTGVNAEDENAVFAAVQAEMQKKDQAINQLQNKLNEGQEAQAKALVDSAVKAGKIPEKLRSEYEAMASSNFETVKKVIEGMPEPKNLEASLKGKQTGDNDQRKDWTWKDYERKDPDALLNMKRNEPEKYQALFDAEYK